MVNNILFSGYYGYQNTGDDSFIEVLSWGAENYWKFDKSIFNVNNVPVIQTKNVLFNVMPKIKGLNIIYKGYSIIKSKNIVLGGGSLFSNGIAFLDETNLIYLKNYLCKNQQIGAIGVSIGPYKSIAIEKKYIDLFKKFKFLTLRDKESFDIASSYNLPFKPLLTFDLAALLPKLYGNNYINPNPKPNKVLGISVCNYESYIKGGNLKKENDRNTYFLKLIIRVCHYFDKNIKINFYVFNGNNKIGDYALTNFYIYELNKIGFFNIKLYNYNSNVKTVWESIRYNDVFIATRLHASIFSYFNNIPFFLIEYHRKCTEFLNTINYPTEQRIYESIDSLNSDFNKIVNVLQNKENYKAPSKKEFFQQLSLNNFTSINFR